ncbi:MAG: hypothetical protein ACLRXP_08990 [Oscillospiraceae bacterium]
MKKFTAILLAVVMLFALSASAFAATNSLETDYAIGDGLGVSVDLNIEGMYFDGVDILNTATNGYYPFSFSLIASDRTKVASVTVSNGGSFHWAYEEDGNGGYVTDEDGNYVESTTTKYGVVVLPTTSASTVTVTGTGNIGSATFSCAQPCGGTTAAGTALYAYLPAPAQFVNEGVTTGGWGDAYDSTGTTLKGTSATGVSLGFFGGYAVYEFENPIADDPTHPYGADFIVYGNAFWNNSEAGCIQVSQGPDDNGNWEWYDIAGSMYYTKSTPNASIKFTNPNPNEDKGITTAGATSTLADVSYDLTVNGTTTPGTVTKNTFHNHSWFPLNANYFAASGSRAAMAKVDEFSFVSRTLNSDSITDTLTFTGTLLNNYPGTGKTDQIGFGYCDVHPNKTLGGTIAYNPYQTFTSSSDYDTKVAGTSGGDPIDIAWAVKSNGTPAKLGSIKYVRIYTGMAQMNGIFGEISTEVCGVAACTGTGTGAAGKTLTIKKDLTSYKPESGWSKSLTPGAWTIKSSASNVYINGARVDASSGYSLTVESGKTYQIITQNGTESPIVAVVTGK